MATKSGDWNSEIYKERAGCMFNQTQTSEQGKAQHSMTSIRIQYGWMDFPGWGSKVQEGNWRTHCQESWSQQRHQRHIRFLRLLCSSNKPVVVFQGHRIRFCQHIKTSKHGFQLKEELRQLTAENLKAAENYFFKNKGICEVYQFVPTEKIWDVYNKERLPFDVYWKNYTTKGRDLNRWSLHACNGRPNATLVLVGIKVMDDYSSDACSPAKKMVSKINSHWP